MLATSEARLGRSVEAEAAFARLDEVMAEGRYARDLDAQGFHRSAKRIMESLRTK